MLDCLLTVARFCLLRPGHGAPTGDIRKKKFTEYQLDRSLSSSNLNQLDQYVKGPAASLSKWGSALGLENSSGPEAMSFGRPGYGAPVRTGSGRLRSEVRGNPEIRFQANEGVQNSICNQIRYAASKEEKAKYHSELGRRRELCLGFYRITADDQIKWRRQVEEVDKSNSLNVSKELEKVEGNQWGKPGPGGCYWRDSALTGQGFYEKMVSRGRSSHQIQNNLSRAGAPLLTPERGSLT